MIQNSKSFSFLIVLQLLQKAGYAPELYATFNNGLAYKFIPGEILTVDTVRSLSVYPLVARMVAKLHRLDCGESVERMPALWDKIAQFIRLLPDQYSPSEKHDRFVLYFIHSYFSFRINAYCINLNSTLITGSFH